MEPSVDVGSSRESSSAQLSSSSPSLVSLTPSGRLSSSSAPRSLAPSASRLAADCSCLPGSGSSGASRAQTLPARRSRKRAHVEACIPVIVLNDEEEEDRRGDRTAEQDCFVLTVSDSGVSSALPASGRARRARGAKEGREGHPSRSALDASCVKPPSPRSPSGSAPTPPSSSSTALTQAATLPAPPAGDRLAAPGAPGPRPGPRGPSESGTKSSEGDRSFCGAQDGGGRSSEARREGPATARRPAGAEAERCPPRHRGNGLDVHARRAQSRSAGEDARGCQASAAATEGGESEGRAEAETPSSALPGTEAQALRSGHAGQLHGSAGPTPTAPSFDPRRPEDEASSAVAQRERDASAPRAPASQQTLRAPVSTTRARQRAEEDVERTRSPAVRVDPGERECEREAEAGREVDLGFHATADSGSVQLQLTAFAFRAETAEASRGSSREKESQGASGGPPRDLGRDAAQARPARGEEARRCVERSEDSECGPEGETGDTPRRREEADRDARGDERAETQGEAGSLRATGGPRRRRRDTEGDKSNDKEKAKRGRRGGAHLTAGRGEAFQERAGSAAKQGEEGAASEGQPERRGTSAQEPVGVAAEAREESVSPSANDSASTEGGEADRKAFLLPAAGTRRAGRGRPRKPRASPSASFASSSPSTAAAAASPPAALSSPSSAHARASKKQKTENTRKAATALTTSRLLLAISQSPQEPNEAAALAQQARERLLAIARTQEKLRHEQRHLLSFLWRLQQREDGCERDECAAESLELGKSQEGAHPSVKGPAPRSGADLPATGANSDAEGGAFAQPEGAVEPLAMQRKERAGAAKVEKLEPGAQPAPEDATRVRATEREDAEGQRGLPETLVSGGSRDAFSAFLSFMTNAILYPDEQELLLLQLSELSRLPFPKPQRFPLRASQSLRSSPSPPSSSSSSRPPSASSSALSSASGAASPSLPAASPASVAPAASPRSPSRDGGEVAQGGAPQPPPAAASPPSLWSLASGRAASRRGLFLPHTCSFSFAPCAAGESPRTSSSASAAESPLVEPWSLGGVVPGVGTNAAAGDEPDESDYDAGTTTEEDEDAVTVEEPDEGKEDGEESPASGRERTPCASPLAARDDAEKVQRRQGRDMNRMEFLLRMHLSGAPPAVEAEDFVVVGGPLQPALGAEPARKGDKEGTSFAATQGQGEDGEGHASAKLHNDGPAAAESVEGREGLSALPVAAASQPEESSAACTSAAPRSRVPPCHLASSSVGCLPASLPPCLWPPSKASLDSLACPFSSLSRRAPELAKGARRGDCIASWLACLPAAVKAFFPSPRVQLQFARHQAPAAMARAFGELRATAQEAWRRRDEEESLSCFFLHLVLEARLRCARADRTCACAAYFEVPTDSQRPAVSADQTAAPDEAEVARPRGEARSPQESSRGEREPRGERGDEPQRTGRAAEQEGEEEDEEGRTQEGVEEEEEAACAVGKGDYSLRAARGQDGGAENGDPGAERDASTARMGSPETTPPPERQPTPGAPAEGSPSHALPPRSCVPLLSAVSLKAPPLVGSRPLPEVGSASAGRGASPGSLSPWSRSRVSTWIASFPSSQPRKASDRVTLARLVRQHTAEAQRPLEGEARASPSAPLAPLSPPSSSAPAISSLLPRASGACPGRASASSAPSAGLSAGGSPSLAEVELECDADRAARSPSRSVSPSSLSSASFMSAKEEEGKQVPDGAGEAREPVAGIGEGSMRQQREGEEEDPLGDEGEEDPLGGEGEEDPLGGEGEEDPLGDEGEEDPLGDEGEEDPLGDEGEENPLGDEGEEDPLGDEGEEDPLGDEGEEDPLGDEGEEDPLGDEGEASCRGNGEARGSQRGERETRVFGREDGAVPQGRCDRYVAEEEDRNDSIDDEEVSFQAEEDDDEVEELACVIVGEKVARQHSVTEPREASGRDAGKPKANSSEDDARASAGAQRDAGRWAPRIADAVRGAAAAAFTILSPRAEAAREIAVRLAIPESQTTPHTRGADAPRVCVEVSDASQSPSQHETHRTLTERETRPADEAASRRAGERESERPENVEECSALTGRDESARGVDDLDGTGGIPTERRGSPLVASSFGARISTSPWLATPPLSPSSSLSPRASPPASPRPALAIPASTPATSALSPGHRASSFSVGSVSASSQPLASLPLLERLKVRLGLKMPQACFPETPAEAARARESRGKDSPSVTGEAQAAEGRVSLASSGATPSRTSSPPSSSSPAGGAVFPPSRPPSVSASLESSTPAATFSRASTSVPSGAAASAGSHFSSVLSEIDWRNADAELVAQFARHFGLKCRLPDGLLRRRLHQISIYLVAEVLYPLSALPPHDFLGAEMRRREAEAAQRPQRRASDVGAAAPACDELPSSLASQAPPSPRRGDSDESARRVTESGDIGAAEASLETAGRAAHAAESEHVGLACEASGGSGRMEAKGCAPRQQHATAETARVEGRASSHAVGSYRRRTPACEEEAENSDASSESPSEGTRAGAGGVQTEGLQKKMSQQQGCGRGAAPPRSQANAEDETARREKRRKERKKARAAAESTEGDGRRKGEGKRRNEEQVDVSAEAIQAAIMEHDGLYEKLLTHQHVELKEVYLHLRSRGLKVSMAATKAYLQAAGVYFATPWRNQQGE
ncbi:hypothetical protein BESB_028360 [Besnoitia besnoiti]|uniref:Structure-specific endonuclease subunit SLX4 n=1 Tax=Besnoitia besnoiti TaxID=94643 RepID=A0A2A9M521_BESBE|nr:uncharacterized protein BESB_028360 [Besnoitia besnoiti]PFH31401.1 hypothetical protein BESB_028360 [Besnoitia besnoiti]